MIETKVIFYTVKDAASKVVALLQAVDRHFLKKEKIKILVPDLTAANFVDELLWSTPKESFRPHSVSAVLSFQNLILISLPVQSSDEFSIVFNLCQTPYTPTSPLKILYELEDLSHPQKAAAFQKKFQIYQKAGFTLSSGSLTLKKN